MADSTTGDNSNVVIPTVTTSSPVVPAPAAPAPDTNREVLAAARAEASDLRARLEAAEAAKTKLEEANNLAERKRLEEEGKWKELAEKEATRAKEIEAAALKRDQETIERLKVSELRARLALEGVEDLDYYLLADRSKLGFADGQIQNLDQVVNDLKSAKPHIFTKPKREVATAAAATNPAPASRVEDIPAKDVRDMEPKEYEAFKKKYIRDLRFRRRA